MSKTNRGVITAILATTALCSVAQAFADETGSTVETVVVTANKRAENIQDVPIAVTAISEDLINRIQANNLNDISAYVPGLSVQPEGVDANRLIIRGLTTGPNDISPTVGVYVDDAPIGSNSGYALGALFSPDIDPYDLDHVEVLRGPQGTLYGASTLAGLVKYVTKTPDLENFDGHLRADLGDEDETGALSESIRAGVNVPIITDEVALRVSGFYSHADGDVTDVRTGQSGLNAFTKKGGRANLLIKPTENLTINLVAVLDDSNVPHIGVVTGNAVTLKPTYGPYAGFDYVDGYSKSSYSLFEANIRYELPDGITATSTTSWSRLAIRELADDTSSFQPAFGAFLGPLFEFAGPVEPTTKRLTEEFRIASPSNHNFEWLAGLFYDHEDSDYLSGINSTYLFGATPPAFLAPTVGALANYETVNSIERYVEKAAFADATYYIFPEFDVSAGLRYSEIDQHLTSQGSGYLALLGVIPTLATPTESADVLTESFDARWHFDPNAMVYVRAARGYRPGGPNVTGASFGPDTTWNYELGLKGTALDGKLTADLSAFYINWQNIQLNFFNGTTTVIGNAGNARSEGVEFEGTYVPVEGLTLSANLTYTDAYITSLVPGATGGAAVGNALPYDSTWAGALRADYYFPLSPQIVGNVGSSLRYKSSFNTTFPGDTGTRFYKLPSETFFDLRTGISYENYSLDFQILNVADERVLSGASEYLAVTQAAADAFGQPADLTYTMGRTYGLSLTAHF